MRGRTRIQHYPERVYLLHGLMGTSYAHFGAQIVRWGEFGVVPLDLPGHGRCPVPPQTDYFAEACGYVAAVMDRLGPGHLVAASYLGGPVAVRLAGAQGAPVLSVVLTGFVSRMGRALFEASLRGFHRLAPEGSELAAAYDRLHGPLWRRTLHLFSDDATSRFDEQVAIGEERLESLGRPVLLVNGSLKQGERESALAVGSRAGAVSGQVVAGAGHLPAVDRPEAFASIVESWWARLPEPVGAGG